MAHLGPAAHGEWRPLSDAKRKSVSCRRRAYAVLTVQRRRSGGKQVVQVRYTAEAKAERREHRKLFAALLRRLDARDRSYQT